MSVLESALPLESDDGLGTAFSASDRVVPRTVLRPLVRFMHLEVASGATLIVAAVIALVWANSPWHASYEQLWHTEVGLEIGSFSLHHSLVHWINDGLMAIFFCVVGLEIKRELVHGQLRDRRAAMLPAIAAVGGMVVPAAVFLAFNLGQPGAGGWGVPMATDIAFAIGVLALVGSRVPTGLKVFLLTLAVADDIGAIVVIAVFYSHGFAAPWFVGAIACLAGVVVCQRAGVRHLGPYLVLGVAAWFALLESGVHATLAGVALGLLTPAASFHRPTGAARAVAARVRTAEGDQDIPTSSDHEHDEAVLWEASRIAREGVSPLYRAEHGLHWWSAFVILPLFALANAGVRISGDGLAADGATLAAIGVGAGLLVGKPVGITLAALLGRRLGLGALPPGVTIRHVVGAGLLGGVGFTVALFVASLAFSSGDVASAAKIGILAGSLLSGVGGFCLLRFGGGRPAQPDLRIVD
jgi:NhaA family Na+:H+ antiporter